MDFRILGPVVVVEQGRTLPLGGGKQLSLFALLLIHANKVVSTDRLVDELWGEQPPPTAAKIVRNYVSLLRKQLGDRLVTRPPGYVLRVEPGELDSERFKARVREAREQEPRTAADTLSEALALWTGPPLAQLAYEPFAQREIARLEELRLQAVEDRIEADLELSQDRELVPELEQLVRDHPLRERLRRMLMLALYRAGRQSDALEVYRNARQTLVDELGLEPSPELQELHRQILAHDPGIAGPPRQARLAARRRRAGLLIFAGAVILLAAAIVAGTLELTSGRARTFSRVAPNSVGVIDPKSNRIVAQIPLGSTPTAIARGEDALWTANSSDHTVTRIDPNTRAVVKTIAVPGAPSGLVVSGRNLWVLLLYSPNASEDAYVQDAGIAQIDTSANDVLGSFRLSATVWGYFDTIAAGARVLWAADAGVVSRVDPVRGRVTTKITIENESAPRLALGAGAVWALAGSAVERINPTSARVEYSIPITGSSGPTPNAVAVGRGTVWVANRVVPPPSGVLTKLQVIHRATPGTVSRIDPRTNAVVATIQAGRYSDAIAVGAGAVWVANRADGTLSKIDPTTNQVTTIKVGGHPTGITTADDRVWVTVT